MAFSAASPSSHPLEELHQRTPRYPGEDTTPTSKQEIWGWYAYGIAAEVFAVCAVGSFLPLTLEQLARERGVLQSSHLPCVGPDSPTTSPGNGTESPVLTRDGDEKEQCVVGLFGLQINTASFAMYTFSLAVLVQALTLVSFSALADYGNNRKTLLLGFGIVGSVTSMLFMTVAPPVFVLGSILAVIGVTCLGSSFVVLNSFLPVLVANDPSVQDAKEETEELPHLNAQGHYTNPPSPSVEDEDFDNDRSPHQPESETKEQPPVSPELQLSTRISSKGVGLGYCAAVVVQIFSIVMLVVLNKTSVSKASATLPLRFVLLLVGVWWFSFTMVCRMWLRNRPGPPLESTGANRSRWRVWLHLVGFSWKSLWKTIKVAVKLREVLVFLIAWFLLSDAVATVSGTAILFARTELKLSTTSVGLLSITAMTSGMAGAFFWPKWGVFGLQQQWEIFPMAFVHGVVSGGFSSYCRSFFGQLIPPGSEAAFYALYAATDKGSSFIGPAIVGVLIDATGQVRSGFVFIAILIVLPIPLIWMVNVEKGRRDGVAMAEMLHKSHDDSHVPEFDAYTEEAEGLLARH
ncbi:hypothetical protein PHISCL_07066 [Aspergillus sclerotialis]|uniref:Autophagy-related protein n=1 Tax=Aspergillus sclerotialis TaxID=2070753 RepID=A0A3A2ZE62_9EURO|nr:hypothetical protein PHISCL_07066 [Aspergillus sclerotialis]